jgi:4-hydroxy-3-polyprenylbenzoate decarboxylase
MRKLCGRDADNVYFYNPRDIGAKIASGSALFDGMVIVPCTMGTLGAIAHGICDNLIHRAADVTLKEGRKLVIVPRETPLSAIHLENMLSLTRVGARIVPAMPGFYHQPAQISDLVDMMVMKIFDQMGIRTDLVQRWKEHEKPTSSQKVVVGVPKFDMGIA